MQMVPPSGVYFTELLTMFTKACWIRILSPITFSCRMSWICTFSVCPFSSARGCTIPSRLSIRLDRLNSSSFRVSVPASILLISSTSLMMASRCLLAEVIFPRHSVSFSGSCRWVPAMAVMPMMAFMGVRMSWDIRERKSVLALLARLAAS